MRLEPALCAICNVDDCTPVAVGEDFEYATTDIEFMAVQCRRCSLVYLNPRPDSSSIGDAYPSHYHAFDFKKEGLGFIYQVRERLEARRLLKWCRTLPEDARILDFGCGDGFHMQILKKFGHETWQIEGIDCDARAVEGARRRGFEIHQGMIEEVHLNEGSYDLILMIMTIEHLAHPTDSLKRVSALLRPGGRVVIVTDNTGSPDFAIFGNRCWGGYHFPRHLYLFNQRNLALICRIAGLQPVSVVTAVSPVNWTYSLRNWIQDWKGPSWLYRFFSLESPLALATFTLLDIPLTWLNRGAILQAVVERTSDASREPK